MSYIFPNSPRVETKGRHEWSPSPNLHSAYKVEIIFYQWTSRRDIETCDSTQVYGIGSYSSITVVTFVELPWPSEIFLGCLDDFLISPSPLGVVATLLDCQSATIAIGNLMRRLGLSRKVTNGEWVGSQVVSHLGFVIDTKDMKFYIQLCKVKKYNSCRVVSYRRYEWDADGSQNKRISAVNACT